MGFFVFFFSSRLADLLVAGVVTNQVLQPHESHIPFVLQFMIDHHLFGMNHIHLANVWFRITVSDGEYWLGGQGINFVKFQKTLRSTI